MNDSVSWITGNDYGLESRYDRFKFSWPIANGFYVENVLGIQCVNVFFEGLRSFCQAYDIDYEKEFVSNQDTKEFRIQLHPGVCIISLLLNSEDEPETVIICATAFKYTKQLRDSIWDTKTLFGLPVLCVLHEDEDFTWHPHNFIVTIFPRKEAYDINFNY